MTERSRRVEHDNARSEGTAKTGGWHSLRYGVALQRSMRTKDIRINNKILMRSSADGTAVAYQWQLFVHSGAKQVREESLCPPSAR